MNYSIAIKYHGSYRQWLVVLLCGYTALVLIGLKDYIAPLSAQFIFGVTAIAFSVRRGMAEKQALRYGTCALALALMYVLVPAKTFLFMSLATAVICLLATFHFRTNVVTVLSIAMMSPIFDYAVSVFSFPMKMYVTAAAARIIALIQPGIRAEGNFIVSGDSEFSVDTACLGLHMLTTSMLAALILVAHFSKVRVLLRSVLSILIIVFLLNVISNLIRIVCLVLWKIPPADVMHDVIGIVCFLLYVIAPLLYIIPKWFLNKQNDEQPFDAPPVVKVNVVMNMLMLPILGIAVFIGKNKSLNGELIPLKNVSVAGYNTSLLDHRVVKLTNENALIYIKPIAGFFSSDHQPMICWSGSGYEFTRIHEKEIGGTTVYAATLEKGDEQLYTAWWYDNGLSTTISQFEWRWDALRTHHHYAIVNVTASTPEMLEKEARKMILLKIGKRV